MFHKALFNLATPLHKKSSVLYIYKNTRFLHADTHYDIIIVGGGLIGATLACTLGNNKNLCDRKVLLIEAGKARKWNFSADYSNRVSALNQGTSKLLNEIGVWKHIAQTRFGVIKSMQVWENCSEAMIQFNSDELKDDLAYIVENDVTLGGVYRELERLSNVTIINEANIKACKLVEEGIQRNEVTLKDGPTYSCELLLGCDGYQSQVRKAMGVHYVSYNYNQMGVVATLELEEMEENTTAWQRQLTTGPVALLPLNNKLSSLVWTTTPQNAKELLTSTEIEFVEKLNKALWENSKRNPFVEESTKAFDSFLHILNLPSTKGRQFPPKIVGCKKNSRAAFPLGFGHSTNYVAKGVALLGDAAHRVHPLAGQGVNLGFGDITCLNKIVGEAAYEGSELGHLLYLKEYETERQRHNIPTMLAIDGFNRLYSTEFPPVVFLRSVGLQAINALTPLKGLMKQHAAS